MTGRGRCLGVDDGAAHLLRTRAAQGLPRVITDPAALTRLAAALAPAARRGGGDDL